jgi:hypothetical protein
MYHLQADAAAGISAADNGKRGGLARSNVNSEDVQM